MTITQLIRYLRLNVQLQDPDGAIVDPEFLSLTDEDVLLYLNVVLTRDFPQVESLDNLPTEDIYPLILLAKKELFFALAVKQAPLFDIGADNNNYLKRDQRFEHYMKLIAQVDKEYNQFNEDGGAGGKQNTLTSYDVLLSDRYATKRNYEKGVTPVLSVYVGGVTETTIEVYWKVSMSRFFQYKVYISTKPILDEYNLINPVSSDAKLVTTIQNVHDTGCRIEGLLPNTNYHIVVTATEMSSLTGKKEIQATTLPTEVI